jgi:hypothetical protein
MKDFGQFITERQVLTDQSRIFQTWTIHFNFSNVSAISWRPVLVVEEAIISLAQTSVNKVHQHESSGTKRSNDIKLS